MGQESVPMSVAVIIAAAIIGAAIIVGMVVTAVFSTIK
jgi:hypothetical protein